MRAQDIGWSNAISLIRVGLAFVFLLSFRNFPGPALAISVATALAAQATDHLDGYLVRRLSRPSVSGWVCDSLADRAFYIAALLAFEREYGTNEFVVWVFALRELALYGIRVVTGDFEPIFPAFRKLALAHAAIVRAGIVFGCVIPFAPRWGLTVEQLTSILTAVMAVATTFGYANLWLLLRRLS